MNAASVTAAGVRAARVGSSPRLLADRAAPMPILDVGEGGENVVGTGKKPPVADVMGACAHARQLTLFNR